MDFTAVTGTTLEWAIIALIAFAYVTSIAYVLAVFVRTLSSEWKEIDNESSQVQDGGRSLYRNPGKNRTSVHAAHPDGQRRDADSKRSEGRRAVHGGDRLPA